MNIKQENAKDLVQFIRKATSPFHVVKEGVKALETFGFQELDMSKPWKLEANEKYYTKPFDSTFFAFSTGNMENPPIDFRIVASHTDQPCLKIKPVAEIKEGPYLKVNADVYGGAIFSTWMDRPLSIAGKVSLKSDDVFHPEIRLVDFQKPILTIPNLAIHSSPEVNNGFEWNKQKELLPLIGMLQDSLNKEHYFMDFLGRELKVDPEDILDFDLYIYNAEEGQVVGINDEFISSPRLDNLTSVYASIKAIINSKRTDGINILAAFDNEEIGSRTKQGADSLLLSMLLSKIYNGFHRKESENSFYDTILQSMMVSVDVSHAAHPNYPEKTDPGNKNYMNQGIAIKIDLNQKYASDTEGIAIIQQICEKHKIPYQKFVKHSNIRGGGTLGSLASSQLPMRTVDVGIPLLAMHSSRELMGIKDQMYLEQLLTAFLN